MVCKSEYVLAHDTLSPYILSSRASHLHTGDTATTRIYVLDNLMMSRGVVLGAPVPVSPVFP